MSEYADELAELALGVLTGRERARALSHVESCQRCADELEQLSRVADAVVQVAPEMEPPMGFEVRLFEKMGVTDVPAAAPAPPAVALGAGRGGRAAAAAGLGLGPEPDARPPGADRHRAGAAVRTGVVTGRSRARTARRSGTW